MQQQEHQEYFEAVYFETFEKVSRYVFFKAPGLSEAEDVTATVYANFYQHVVLKNKRPANHLSYLIQMSNHELSRMYSKKIPLLSFDDGDLQLSDTVTDNDDWEIKAFEPFESEDLWKAVNKLSQSEQQVLFAKFRFDMTFQEIAAALKQGESAVKLRYYRSLKKLKNLLDKCN
ncbi:MAG: sigma-70 family RNA polymerase sigma factor [Eubacteriales bacterium]